MNNFRTFVFGNKNDRFFRFAIHFCMIHEIYPHQFHNHYQPDRVITETDYVIQFSENRILLKQTPTGLQLPQKSDFSTLETRYLFAIDQQAFYLSSSVPTDELNGYEYKEMQFFRTYTPNHHAWAAIVASHLNSWYLQNRFCGSCGSPLHHKSDERAMQCSRCNLTVYPKISPAIIVAIICNDKILLARNAGFTANWYSLIAGYVDAGETLEETVAREVKEEVGLTVSNIRYYTSQPWPFSSSMMIGFVAYANDSEPIKTDGTEITEAAWFSRTALPNHPPNLSIAGMMIEKFRDGKL